MSQSAPPELLPAKQLKRLLGDPSAMTLHRWIRDPRLSFPQPIYIQHRRFWLRDDVEAWIAARPTNNSVLDR